MKAKDLAKCLSKKGFVCSNGGSHDNYYFYYQGVRTYIRVSVSRGSKSDYGSKLLSHVMKEMYLNKEMFQDFVDCPLTEEKYIEHLIEIEKIRFTKD